METFVLGLFTGATCLVIFAVVGLIGKHREDKHKDWQEIQKEDK